MAASTSPNALHALAQACIYEWTARPGDLQERVSLKATIKEGKRKEGVTKELFEYMFHVVTSMNCWDPTQAQAPWKEIVSYELQPEHLETGVETLRRTKTHLSSTLTCDFKGDDATLLLAYQEKDVPAVHVRAGTHAHMTVAMEKGSCTKNYIRPEASFHKIVVEMQKTWTYREHFDWEYTFSLKYREPYYDTSDLMADLREKNLIFCDPPMCCVEIVCAGVKEVTDAQYLADSLLCKIRDLLPPEWKASLTP